MVDKKCPCKGCGHRYDACHDTCVAYIEWHKYRQFLMEDPDKEMLGYLKSHKKPKKNF